MAGQGSLTPYIRVRISTPQPIIFQKGAYMERLGSIYLITDKTNGKQYVGQTARDVAVRFDEHWYSKHMTPLHQAMSEKKLDDFSLKVIEKVPLEQLDERERYWIAELDTYKNGYNATLGGQEGKKYQYLHLKVIENGYIIDSTTELVRIINNLNGWKCKYLIDQIRKSILNKSDFLGYHFEETKETDFTDIDTIEEWVKTLNIRFQGQHIYCFELDKEFATVGEAARYLINNNYYVGTSQMPQQTLVTGIGHQLHGRSEYVNSSIGNLTFSYAPGTTKGVGGDFVSKAVYCPEIDKKFNSQTECAEYFLNEKIWTGIKLKTAKLRISDVVNGNFPHYKNYTFKKVD